MNPKLDSCSCEHLDWIFSRMILSKSSAQWMQTLREAPGVLRDVSGGWQYTWKMVFPPGFHQDKKKLTKSEGSSRKAGFLQAVPSEKTSWRSPHSHQALKDQSIWVWCAGEEEQCQWRHKSGECTRNTVKFGKLGNAEPRGRMPVGGNIRNGVWGTRPTCSYMEQQRNIGHEGPWSQPRLLRRHQEDGQEGAGVQGRSPGKRQSSAT